VLNRIIPTSTSQRMMLRLSVAPGDTGVAGFGQGSAYVFVTLVNQPPTISAVANSRRQGAPASASTIATVSDPD
jgi:hypothetical protein